MNNIEGTWLSRYEYTEGSNSEPSVSEHRIAFKLDGNKWIGESISQSSGSKVTLELTESGAELSGHLVRTHCSLRSLRRTRV